MRLRLLVLLCASLPLACGHRSTASTADGGEPPPGIPGSDGSSCPVRYSIATPVSFDCGMDYFGDGELQLDDGRVLYTARQTLGSNSGSDVDLFARDVATGQLQQLTADDLETVLVGAGEGSVLYTTYQPQHTSGQLSLRTAAGQIVDLGTDVEGFGGYFQYSAEESRLISGGAVAWRGAQTIHLHDGSSTHAIATTKGYSVSLDLQGGRLAWSTSDGKDGEVFVYESGLITQLTSDDVDDRRPQLWGTAVLWICGESICRWQAGSTQVLDQGKCTDLIVRQDRAAWVCDSQVMLFDGNKSWPVAGSRGEKVAREGLRLDHGRLLWLEAPQPFAYKAQGKVFFSDGQQTLQVAEVGLPCLVCDAYWPPLQLALQGGVIAWSYFLDGDPPTYGKNRCAYAKLIQQPDCR
jgi:hypothetical protein